MKKTYESPVLLEAGTFATVTGRRGRWGRDRRWRRRWW
ncbi:keywimysin-related RiPP [Allokutzneria albata]|nr:keywimysin-related RiPP [Allokutzneria albata]